MLSPERLEIYMRRVAMLSREIVDVLPFVCLFNRDDALRFYNYARPLAPVGADPAALTGPLAALRSAFRARESAAACSSLWRKPRPIWARPWSLPVSCSKGAIRCWCAPRRRCAQPGPSPA